MRFYKNKAVATAAASAGLALGLAVQPMAHASGPAGAACETLVGAVVPGARVISAAVVAAGGFILPMAVPEPGLRERAASLPAFCRVQANAAPTPDSNIGIELWLPLEGWNGRFLGTGNGGAAGSIAYGMGMIEGLKRGFAVANTDMGVAPDIAQVDEHPERWKDFGHRATHDMTRVAKAFVGAFYKVGVFRSYFEGCSTGGQQALVMAQRYPGDYDGILAGAPGNNRTHSSSYFLWNYQTMNAALDAKLSPLQWSMVSSGVLAACAGKDGGAPGDRFLTDPRRCGFDPGSLPQCAAGGISDQCLTALQLSAIRRLYMGPVNPVTGERIYPGLTPGSEALPLGPSRFSDPSIVARLFVMRWGLGRAFSADGFDFDRDMDRIDARLSSTLNANDSDLNEFARRGGKLMLYSGLADPGVPFNDVVQYYDRVLATSTAAEERDFARLFLVPGMGHCVGGPGVTDIGQPFSHEVPSRLENDALMTLVAWTEGAPAPQQLVARKPAASDAPGQARPICAYPAFPEYRGGEVGNPDSFACVEHARGSSQPSSARYLN
ncbi:tannase/feruloyl esterase family alpha/beta hydrolase [Massilia sp. LXY-6]|uniref:tannase/feruloyl esterase family alpha/beta hydrolase n=1 Tax=Massilia sp. LXY-6 TaxID=3379823 RepID=UPI003EDFA3AB